MYRKRLAGVTTNTKIMWKLVNGAVIDGMSTVKLHGIDRDRLKNSITKRVVGNVLSFAKAKGSSR